MALWTATLFLENDILLEYTKYKMEKAVWKGDSEIERMKFVPQRCAE